MKKMSELTLNEIKRAIYTYPSKNFDCKKMVNKCEALCCHNVPMELDRFERNKHRLINKEVKILKLGVKTDENLQEKEFILPLTENLRCPFNDEKNGYRCNIYDDRPHVCKVYGNGKSSCTTCPFYKANGGKRGKVERNKLVKLVIDDLTEVAGKIDKALLKLK